MVPRRFPERVPKLDLLWERFWETPGTLLGSLSGSLSGYFFVFLFSRCLFALLWLSGFISGCILRRFWCRFEVKNQQKFLFEFYTIPNGIWGAPGDVQARKIWFYKNKTKVFQDPSLSPRAPSSSILEPKRHPKRTQNGSHDRSKM